MKAIRRILVAVKNPEARQLPGVDKAVQLACAFSASLELFHAIVDPVHADLELTESSLEELRFHRIQLHRHRLETAAFAPREKNLKISTCVEWDHPAHESIVRRAIATKADLIVAECHAGRRLAPWILHLTDWELLRTSPIPVLLVKSAEQYLQPVVLAAVDPTHAHAKPARLDEAILRSSLAFTRALSGSLHAMHARFPIPLDVPASEIVGDRQADRLYTRSEARVRRLFEKFAVHARIPRARRHLVDRDPVAAIPETAKKIGADLVVMGAVSRSGLKRAFIGNTAERVLGALRCDVLVVKPRRFAQRVRPTKRRLKRVAPQPLSVF